MISFSEIGNGIFEVRVNYNKFSEHFLKENYAIDAVIDYLNKDLNGETINFFRNIDNFDIVVNKEGLFIDFSRYVKTLLRPFNIDSIDLNELLNLRIRINDKVSSFNDFKSRVSDRVYNAYLKFEADSFEMYKKFAYREKEKIRRKYINTPVNDSYGIERKRKLKKVYDNFNTDSYARKLCLEDFLKDYRKALNLAISFLKVSKTRRLVHLENLCDMEKIYYYVAMVMSYQGSSMPKNEIISYLIKYLEHIKEYLKKDLTINNISIGFGYQDKKRYSVKRIIDYVEANSNYKFRSYDFDNDMVDDTIVSSQDGDSSKQDAIKVKNLEVYDYNFFESNNPKLIRDKLEGYRILGRRSSDYSLRDLLDRKIDYYIELDVKSIRQGINRYDGYIGFEVGDKIVLEHFFDDVEKGKISKDEAIYIINESDFDFVTKLGKLDVIDKINNGELDAVRVYHIGDWEDRISKILKKK